MAYQEKKFDGLSDDYDRYRPRYPAELLREIARKAPDRDRLHVVDAGAGTGIALEGLVPLLGPDCRYEAVDVSSDMVAKGRAKFPEVAWSQGPAEPFLEKAGDVDLIVAAQSFQWMDRPRFLHAAQHCLNPEGVVAIIQNNRNYGASSFLDAYESLLEEVSPGYSRHYRDFDFKAELTEVFGPQEGVIEVTTADWEMPMPRTAFVGMAKSSTQVQRGISTHGDVVVERIAELVDRFSEGDTLSIPYRSELFTAQTPAAGAGGR
ncbi:class I SAM-dependent methyltransferase [Streptomyces sp. S186]|uniref:class I SAM-dependent methyltransferase n=1 Tax=Streptomyces sp. S186 TaxID=3434395 RepID=UPI003F66ED58